jgi:2'-5' RNA ligase
MPTHTDLAQPPGTAAAADRLFFALYPDDAAAAGMAALAAELRRELGLRGRAIAPGRLHVTLHHLGDHPGVPRALVDAASQVASQIDGPPVVLAFDRVASFTRRRANRPIVLLGDEQPGVRALHARLTEALASAGLGGYLEKRFTPHVTLLYDDQAVRERPVAPVGWVSRELVLVHSLIGRGLHRPLGRWPLRG